jgi:hypothetical protein
MVLFSVIADIFRNRDSSGIAKACWIVLLIVLPILTVIVYIIVNGSGMAQRNVERSKEVQAQQESYIKNVAGGKSPSEQVAQAKSLLDSGAISQAEYESMKAKALS